jgi:GNAT superfamily N-acetyltransferase
MIPVEVRELRNDELSYGAGVGARGMRDNPMVVGVLGHDPAHRLKLLSRTYAAWLPRMKSPPLGAFRAGHVVAVAGMAPPGTCKIGLLDSLRMIPSIRAGLGDTRRTFKWMADWEERDINEPHWHVGPVAVEAGLQGLGIGSQIMQRLVELVGERAEVAYLETDKPENVMFYERFGFETIDEGKSLGVRNWFMRREPGPRH